MPSAPVLFALVLLVLPLAAVGAAPMAEEPAGTRFVVRFDEPVRSEWRRALEAEADLVYGPLPGHAYLVRLGAGDAQRVAALPHVVEVAPYAAERKLSPHLPREGVVAATVVAYPDEPEAAVLAALRAGGARVLASARTGWDVVVDVEAPASRLESLARLDLVRRIEPAGDEGGLDNANASALVQGGAPGLFPLHDRGVNGSSQTVGVCDSGLGSEPVGLAEPYVPPVILRAIHETQGDPNGNDWMEYNRHLYPVNLPLGVHRKVQLYHSPQEGGNRGDALDILGHGTHVAATLAGDATPYGVRNKHDGVAFAARLVVCDIVTRTNLHILNDYANYWLPAYAEGARVHSNSWGSLPTTEYTLKARQHDAFVWERRDLVIARSVGNSLAFGAARPEALAKNVLAVGGTLNDGAGERMGSFATELSPDDGRIKPDVVAPGQCVVSAWFPGTTSSRCESGTSMATAVAAGSAVLVRDHFAKGFLPGAPSNPSSALVRAVLAASGDEVADDLGAAGFPNRVQGWGRVSLADVLPFEGDGRLLFVQDEGTGLETNGSASFSVTVGEGRPLRVFLAWTDAPAEPGANPALVNDLDLVVTGPDGTTRFGNGGADRKNVIEAVRLDAPAAGTYVVTVRAHEVAWGPQPFALVVAGARP